MLAEMTDGRVSRDQQDAGFATSLFGSIPFSKFRGWWESLPPQLKTIATSAMVRAAVQYLPVLFVDSQRDKRSLAKLTHLGEEMDTGLYYEDVYPMLSKLALGLEGLGEGLTLTGVYAPLGALLSTGGSVLGAHAAKKSGTLTKSGSSRARSTTSSERAANQPTEGDKPVDPLLFDLLGGSKKKKRKQLEKEERAQEYLSTAFDPDDPETWKAFFKTNEMRTVAKVLNLAQLSVPETISSPESEEEVYEYLYPPQQNLSPMQGYYSPGFANALVGMIPGANIGQLGSPAPYTMSQYAATFQRDCGCAHSDKHTSIVIPGRIAVEKDQALANPMVWDAVAVATGGPTIAELLTDLVINSKPQSFTRPANLFDGFGHCTHCDGQLPHQSASMLYDGEEPFYTSSWFRARFSPMASGEFGVINISDRPFEIRINPEAPLPRATVSLVHEMLHAMDYMMKLGLSHEQVHNVAFMLVGEVLPGITAMKQAYGSR
jgi:hypothetical protein